MERKSESTESSECGSDRGERQVYIPTASDKDLDVNEQAYTLLEYISLEWPAQSITSHDKSLYLGTNPDQSHRKAVPQLLEIDLKETDFQNLRYKSAAAGHFINKIVYSDGLYALSDDHLVFYSHDLSKRAEVPLEAAYGLCVTDDLVLAGTSDGYLAIYKKDLSIVGKYKLHDAAIDSIVCTGSVIYTGSSDRSVAISDISGNISKRMINSSEVNCLDISGNKLVFGDDDGNISLCDIRTDSIEKISWHKAPISAIRWRDDDIFASGSKEQFCLWDTSLTDESEYHRYLLFVHQGQNFYKDCYFMDDMVITTSQDGLCLFTPISFNEEELHSIDKD